MNNNKLAVTFINPKNNARQFEADLSPDCTGKMAVDGLVAGDHNGPFLDPAPPGRPYELIVKRSSSQITPNGTFRDAGVINGDVIEIRQALQGA